MSGDSREKDNPDTEYTDADYVKEVFETFQRGSEEILVEEELKNKIVLSVQNQKPLKKLRSIFLIVDFWTIEMIVFDIKM